MRKLNIFQVLKELFFCHLFYGWQLFICLNDLINIKVVNINMDKINQATIYVGLNDSTTHVQKFQLKIYI